MLKALIIIASISSVVALTGCTTGYISPGDGNPTMEEVYHAAVSGQTKYAPGGDTDNTDNAGQSSPEAALNRASLPALHHAQHRTSVHQTLASQFPLLPNPESQLYIFGHYAGNEQVPVPGHFTVFALYTRNHYALPSEVMTPYNDGQFTQEKG